MIGGDYDAHEALVAPARNGRAGLGWTIGGLIAVQIVVNLLTLTAFRLVDGMGGADRLGFDTATLLTGTSPGAMLVILAAFLAFPAALAVVVRGLHRRSFASLWGIGTWAQFRRVLGALLLLNVALFLLPPWAPFEGTRPGLDPGLWAMLLPLGLAGILIQTSAEELLFRGYLQQQLAARFRSPLVWMGAPSAIFAVAHYDPSMGNNAWLIVAWAALFGVLMADLTARAGSIGPATAIHFTNNAIGMLVISPPDYLSGLALFLLPFGMDDAEMVRAWLPVDFALMVVMWLTARLALRR